MLLYAPFLSLAAEVYALSLPLAITTSGGLLRQGEMKTRITAITPNKTIIKTQVAIAT